MIAQTATIRSQNDAFRQWTPINANSDIPGMCMMTAGINALADTVMEDVFDKIRRFKAFNADNDPYHTHDCGCIDHHQAGKVLWKIDYYNNPDLDYGSQNPADPQETFRVLTVMLAHEY